MPQHRKDFRCRLFEERPSAPGLEGARWWPLALARNVHCERGTIDPFLCPWSMNILLVKRFFAAMISHCSPRKNRQGKGIK